MANLLDMQKILGGIQQQYPVTPPTPTPPPTPTVDPKAGRNQKLAMMLYALGGALKGDEDFVVKTLQLQQVQEGKKKEKEQKEAWEKALKNLEGEVQPSLLQLAKALGPERGTGLIEVGLPRQQELPADIKKLGQLKALRERMNPTSESYDPNYTEARFQQDASVLGVSSNLFKKSKKDFIEEYMKDMRTMKDVAGRPLYTDEESRDKAESAYELIYGQEQTEEEVIDLGSL